MSYDLMIFAAKEAPANREAFMDWYQLQVQWNEGHTYDDPIVSTPELRACFMEMIQTYPPMNGPLRSEDIDNPKVTDYSVGKFAIYAAFAYSEAESAYETMFRLAEKHKVGFFNVSSNNGGVYLPDASGAYVCLHGKDARPKLDSPAQTAKFWQFWKKE